ncbi:MAG: glycosyltransferase family 4 protein [Candidatus Caldarchaeum sp.]
MRLALCSQTPLIRLTRNVKDSDNVLDISLLKEGEDYVFSPGGVTRMVYPLLRHMIQKGVLEKACWVSLNPRGPDRVWINGIELINVKIDEPYLKSYGVVKEQMWKIFHGISDDSPSSITELAWLDDYAYYNLYNRVCSETLMELDRRKDFDLFYIHDFQQIPTGHMLATLKPKVFRWHIPFDEKVVPADWAPFLGKYFNSYDAVVVSCRSYLASLRKIGYEGKAYHVYPYIDFSEYPVPSSHKIRELCDRFALGDDDVVIALVARLDPMKGHDLAIKAMAKVVKRFPKVKLVIVGDGSFSSSRQGLGLSKAELWKQKLTSLVENLGLSGNVVFTGHLSQEELGCVYARCDFTLLPSRAEGFGLVVAESWLYGKPAIVSSSAGIAELVENESTGLLVNTENTDEVAEAMSKLIGDEKLRLEMGENARKAVELCSIERGLNDELKVLKAVGEGEQDEPG